MPSDRPFRFAYNVNRPPVDVSEWKSMVLEAVDGGFTLIVLGDHFIEPRYSSAVAFARAAEWTEHLRFSTHVFNNDFRHPAILAKDVATVDQMTGGRVELGIGAGWMPGDYETTGLVQSPGRIRVERMEEAVQIIQGLFQSDPFSFEGSHYRVDRLLGWPKPVQNPLPIFIGGGSRALLGVAARRADIVGVHPVHRGGVREVPSELTRQAVEAKVTWLRSQAGDRYRHLELHVLIRAVGTEGDPRTEAARLGERFQLSPDEALSSPYLLTGPVEKVAEDLLQLRESLDISYFSIRQADAAHFTPVIRLLAGR